MTMFQLSHCGCTCVNIGVANGVIFVSNNIEVWTVRLRMAQQDAGAMPDKHWHEFGQLLDDWMNALHESIGRLGSATLDGADKSLNPDFFKYGHTFRYRSIIMFSIFRIVSC